MLWCLMFKIHECIEISELIKSINDIDYVNSFIM